MSKDRSEELQDLHNEGQKDGFDGNYNPPNKRGIFDEVLWDQGTLDKLREDREAYNKGFEHGRKSR
jgi:hypothetical protein